MAGTVQLVIDDIVVHGLRVVDQDALGRSIEIELSRLVAERGLPRWFEDLSLGTRIGAVEVVASESQELGLRLAEAIYRGVGR